MSGVRLWESLKCWLLESARRWNLEFVYCVFVPRDVEILGEKGMYKNQLNLVILLNIEKARMCFADDSYGCELKV